MEKQSFKTEQDNTPAPGNNLCQTNILSVESAIPSLRLATPVHPVSARGCITSTPKTTDFREKLQKTRKYERSSCMPWRKNGERPYPEAPKWHFWDPGLGPFLCLDMQFRRCFFLLRLNCQRCILFRVSAYLLFVCLQHFSR